LARVPVRLVLCDEVDKWPQWSGREAAPLNLVMERTRTFHDHVVFVASTPTTRDGLIYREFSEGDQRRFLVPYPPCGQFQVLEWSRIRWDNTRIRTANDMREQRQAHYQCRHCGEAIHDVHKRDMLSEGVWVPDAFTLDDWVSGARDEERNEHRSFHLWAAYSPWVTFWRVAATFLDSRGEPSKLQNFTNSWLAEVWEERVESTTDEAIAACIGEHQCHDVPDDVLVITVAVDVQATYVVFMVVGWSTDEVSHVIAVGECQTFDQLEVEIIRPWGDQGLMPRMVVIDSRYRRDEVMDFCRRNPVARMIAGVERTTPIPFSTVRIDKHPKTGAVLPNSMSVWTVNVGMFKDLVAHRLRQSLAEDGGTLGRIHLPMDLDERWLNQMSSEHKVTKRSGNKTRDIWVLKPGRQRNEAWDVLVYNAAAAKMARVDTLRSQTNPPPRPRGGRPGPRVMGRGKGMDLPGGRW